MNFKQFGVLLSVATVLGMNVVATKALAQEEPSIQFGKAISAPGCVIVDQLVGDDGRTLSLLFDDFQAENGKRKRCNIRVNTTIPSGFRVKDVRILYQGSTEVPPGSRGTSLSRSYIFSGGALGVTKAPPAITKFTSDNPLFQMQDSLTFAYASCGGQGQFGINIIANSSPGSYIVIDTDAEIHFELSRC